MLEVDSRESQAHASGENYGTRLMIRFPLRRLDGCLPTSPSGVQITAAIEQRKKIVCLAEILPDRVTLGSRLRPRVEAMRVVGRDDLMSNESDPSRNQ